MTTNEILCSNILRLRKEKGLSQSMLAEKLQITFQSVSKWENNLSCPDISLLPSIAEVLGVSIDELFGIAPLSAEPDSAKTTEHEEELSSLARTIDDTLVDWPDDDKLHAVMFLGHHLLKEQELGDLPSQVELKYEGPVADICSSCSIAIEGNTQITGSNMTAGSHITCGGISNSNVTAGSHITCGGISDSRITAGSHIAAGPIGGADSVHAGSSIQISGDLNCQSVRAGSYITCSQLNSEKLNAAKMNIADSAETQTSDFKSDKYHSIFDAVKSFLSSANIHVNPDETDDVSTERLDDLLDELNDLKDELQDLIDEKNDLADDISDLADDISDLANDLSDDFSPELIDELNDKKDELNDKKDELQEILREIEEKKADIQAKSEQLKNWN